MAVWYHIYRFYLSFRRLTKGQSDFSYIKLAVANIYRSRGPFALAVGDTNGS